MDNNNHHLAFDLVLVSISTTNNIIAFMVNVLCQNLIKLNVENLDVLMKILMLYNGININFYMRLKFDEKISHKFEL